LNHRQTLRRTTRAARSESGTALLVQMRRSPRVVPRQGEMTLYARFCDWLTQLMLVLFGAMLIAGLWKRRMC
jgi:hypothetical protein